MSVAVTAALQVVNARSRTHLVASSPAIPGASPDRTPPLTLCGVPAEDTSLVAVADVDCVDCLWRSGAYLGMPGWGRL